MHQTLSTVLVPRSVEFASLFCLVCPAYHRALPSVFKPPRAVDAAACRASPAICRFCRCARFLYCTYTAKNILRPGVRTFAAALGAHSCLLERRLPLHLTFAVLAVPSPAQTGGTTQGMPQRHPYIRRAAARDPACFSGTMPLSPIFIFFFVVYSYI